MTKLYARFLALTLLVVLTTSVQAQQSVKPLLSVTTQNPKEINVGKPATFVFTVKNEGRTHAMRVKLDTIIPQHAEVTKAVPKPAHIEGLTHSFHLGDIAAGKSQVVTLVAIPRKVALINVSSTVSFATATRTALIVREPKLSVTASITSEVIIGDKTAWTVRVKNIGDGPADAVKLAPKLLEGQINGEFSKPVDFGLLQAGEAKEMKFNIQPTRSGKLAAHFTVSNPDGLSAEQKSASNVLQAKLAVRPKGPRVQPIGRNGEYVVLITNPGDTPTGPAYVTIKIPEGLEITDAADNAWTEETRSLRWRIRDVKPNDKVTVRFQAETNEEGPQQLEFTVKADNAKYIAAANAKLTTTVISRPNPIVTVLNDQEFTAVGSPIAFKINVVNAGSKAAEKLRVRVAIPKELKAVEHPSYKLAGEFVEFPLQKLESGDKISLPFYAIGVTEGEHFVQVLLDGSTLTQRNFVGSAYCYRDSESSSETAANDEKAEETEAAKTTDTAATE